MKLDGQQLKKLLESTGWVDSALLAEAMVICACESGDPAIKKYFHPEDERWGEDVLYMVETKPELFSVETTAHNPNDPHGGSFGIFQINGLWFTRGSADPNLPGNFRKSMRFSSRYGARYALALQQRYGWRPWSTSIHLPPTYCMGVHFGSEGTNSFYHPDAKISHRDLLKLPRPDSRLICNDCYSAKRY